MSFPITCTACHKTFTISDEIYEKKVAGRVVTIKCKACGQGIRVDGMKGSTAAPAAPAPAPAEPASAAPSPAVEAAVAPVAAPAPAEEPLWAVDYPDGQDREFTTADVVAEIERGAVDRTTLVWRDGMAEWLELHQVPELSIELAKTEAKKKAAAAAAAAAAGKAAPVHRPRAPMPTVTGLAGLPGAAPKPRAPQPSSPELLKPRAAQPSWPDLQQPRAPQPSSPELPKPRVLQPSSPALPKPAAPPLPPPPPAAAPPPLATPPLAAPPPPEPLPEVTPPLPASVANVVSRPPHVAAFPGTAAGAAPMAPFGAGPALVADHATVEWPQAKSKTPLIIGVVIVVAAVIGVAVFALGGKEPPPPPATPINALPPGPGLGESPATTTTTPATPTSESAPAQSGSDTASGSDPVATSPDPGATPGAGFAELFAAGARKAESKGATVAPTARFDAAATKAPLAEAATQAQACKQSGGPTGKVTVVVTFAPNGKVSSATVTEPPFAGTATAACIASALKRATIAPFSGLPGTVSKTFSIL